MGSAACASGAEAVMRPAASSPAVLMPSCVLAVVPASSAVRCRTPAGVSAGSCGWKVTSQWCSSPSAGGALMHIVGRRQPHAEITGDISQWSRREEKAAPHAPFFCGGVCGAVVVCARWCPTLPHPGGCSTIGAGWLSFRVRDGSGRFPAAVTTETSIGWAVLWWVGPWVTLPAFLVCLVWAAWGGGGGWSSIVLCGVIPVWWDLWLACPTHALALSCAGVWVVGLVVDRIVGA